MKNFFVPKNIKFGKDIRKIEFHPNKVIKIFKDEKSYTKTLDFLEIVQEHTHFPKVYTNDPDTLQIEMENCGDMLSLYNIPNNWVEQLNQIQTIFIEKKLYILDVRFLPYTPYVINNVCVKNDTIYIIDHVMHYPRSETFIKIKIFLLKLQIKLYIYIKDIFILALGAHIMCEFIRMFIIEPIEIIIYRDISIFYEFKKFL